MPGLEVFLTTMPDTDWLENRFSEIRPKAVAALTRQFRDLDLAEEAFATSCLRAVKNWRTHGLPDDPLAWLLTVGRNAGRDILRKQKRSQDELSEEGSENPETDYITTLDENGLRDDVLRLLFICCHPSLSTQDQSAVALKIVTGMTTEEIASAFLVKPRTMEQRITRAKKAINNAGVPFETPDMMERNRRLNSVMLMLYLLFNEGWSANSGEVVLKIPVCEEAIRLTRLLLTLFPGSSELMGLLALCLFQHSRRNTRATQNGTLVPLEEQDRRYWDHDMIREASSLMEKARRHAAPGSYQIQAAIAAVHASALHTKETNWHEIERLYRALYEFEPTPVIKLNHASALAKTEGPQAALDALSAVSDELATYRWYHAACAAFYHELGKFDLSAHAYQTVLELGVTEQERAFVLKKIAELEKKS